VAYTIVIPARYASTRFPGKPLEKLAGKPILEHVYRCASNSAASHIIIATDDQRIADTAIAFGADVCMTSTQHQSGTERINEVLEQRNISNDEIIVNLQGDEPFMPVACLDQVAGLLAQDASAVMATLSAPIENANDIFNSNIVKVISNTHGQAMYFSRAPIPWQRGCFEDNTAKMNIDYQWQRHIGLYAYRAAYIKKYVDLPAASIEALESLEQLRVLWHGDRIVIAQASEAPGPGIDTREELEKAENYLAATRKK
jgi:3-deoxy-manno-octulosonate cytidylyltransferase (CMP-KDO synthetase)